MKKRQRKKNLRTLNRNTLIIQSWLIEMGIRARHLNDAIKNIVDESRSIRMKAAAQFGDDEIRVILQGESEMMNQRLQHLRMISIDKTIIMVDPV